MLINDQEKDGSFKMVERLYNDVVKSFCASLGVTVVDPLPVFAELAGGKAIFRLGDDSHWSKAAHRLAAEVLFKTLSEEKMWSKLGHSNLL